MSVISNCGKEMFEFVSALGIKNCTGFELICPDVNEGDQNVYLQVKMLVTDDVANELTKVVKKYNLVAQEKNKADAKPMYKCVQVEL